MTDPKFNTRDELEACPFCGQQPKLDPSGEWQYYDSGSIECECGASLFHNEDMRQSGANWERSIIAKWNTRVVAAHSHLED